jgi:chorismate mutase/prephenate dehydrogenase
VPDSVDGLRSRIAELDGRIVELLGDRLALVREIGVAKRAAGLPVRSFSTEAEVLARYEQAAHARGIDPAHARRVARELIAAAVRWQEEAYTVPTAEARRILIVGGAGKMGRWLVRFFEGQGHEVATCDPAGSAPGAVATTLPAGVGSADVILLATPLSSGPAVLREVLSYDPRGLVADIYSLKSHVLDLLTTAARSGRRVTSLHPLFGPSVRTLSGRVMAVLDCGNARAADEAAALFSDTALTITRLPVGEHDGYMQFVLGLGHLMSILFFTTLADSGRSFDALGKVASTTFNRTARIAADLARENPYLYHDIQHLNRHSAELYERVRASLSRIERAALAGDPTAFVALMDEGRRLFAAGVPEELG